MKLLKRNLHKKEKLTALAFVALPVLGFVVFTLLSLVAVVYFSFNDYNIFRDELTPNGLQNYVDLFTNPTYSDAFGRSIFNTVLLLVSIPLGMIAGLALAAVLQSKAVKKASKFFQVLYYLPAVTSAVAVNIVFRYIFNPEYGFINTLFNVEIPWFANDWLVKVAIVLKNVWASMGTSMILYIAGMLAIPQSYYESADVDGASATHKFFKITLPLLTPTTFYIIITNVIGGLQSYADAKVFGNGTSGSQTIVWFIWEYGLNQGKQGLASAASIILAVAIMIVTILQFKFSDRWVYGEEKQ